MDHDYFKSFKDKKDYIIKNYSVPGERESLFQDSSALERLATPNAWQLAREEMVKASVAAEEKTERELQRWSSITPLERKALESVLEESETSQAVGAKGADWCKLMVSDSMPIAHYLREVVDKIAGAIKQQAFFLPNDYKNASFKGFELLCEGHEITYALLTNFGPNPPRGLYLWGHYGTGKTHLISAFARGTLAELTVRHLTKITDFAQEVIRKYAAIKPIYDLITNARYNIVTRSFPKNPLGSLMHPEGIVKTRLQDIIDDFNEDIEYKSPSRFTDFVTKFSNDYEEVRKNSEITAIYNSLKTEKVLEALTEIVNGMGKIEVPINHSRRTYEFDFLREKLRSPEGADLCKRISRLAQALERKGEEHKNQLNSLVDNAWQQVNEVYHYHPTDMAFITFDAFFDRREDEAFVKDFLGRKIVIIDDIHPKEDKARMDFIQRIVEYRYNEVRTGATFVTSNLSPEALLQVKDYPQQVAERVHSRLTEMCMPIKFEASDYRLKIASKANAKLMNLVKELRKKD